METTSSADLGPFVLDAVIQEPSVLGNWCTGKNSLTFAAWRVWQQKLSERTDLVWGIEHEINLRCKTYSMSINYWTKFLDESSKCMHSAQRKAKVCFVQIPFMSHTNVHFENSTISKKFALENSAEHMLSLSPSRHTYKVRKEAKQSQFGNIRI